MQIDPDLSSANDLRRWYLEEGMNVDMTDLTIHSTHQENSKFVKSRCSTLNEKQKENKVFSVPMKTFAQINEYETHLPTSVQGEIVRVKGVCCQTRHDPVYKVNNEKRLKHKRISSRQSFRPVQKPIVKRNFKIITMEHFIVQNAK